MREYIVQCQDPHGLHHMAYVEWGEADNPCVVVCVHGLTRNGRDFDFLARALSQDFRVVCPDVVGRGQSDWLNVSADYILPTYVNDMVTLIARLNVEHVSWVGTSMGGIIGMVLASQLHTPIHRLVLNDIGPIITASATKRIAHYLGEAPCFASVEEAEAYIRLVHAPFGQLTDEQWQHLTLHSIRATPEGAYIMKYDNGISTPFRQLLDQAVKERDMWSFYDAIQCPTLVIRGGDSDLLTRETLQGMAQRGPKAKTIEVPNVGHAPMLMDEQQIALVQRFLLGKHNEIK